MKAFLERIDRFTGAMGALAKAVALASVLACFATLYMRYALGITFIWLNESYIWANAFAIALGSAYAYRDGALVRVDVLYERMKPRSRALVDIIGTVVFLTPFLFVISYYSYPFVMTSYRMGESSPHPSGMPALYLLKGSVLLLSFLIALQAVASLIRNILVWRHGWGERVEATNG